MSVSGTISVAVEFRDSATVASVERMKTISLRDTIEQSGGIVAIVTGTAGTAAVSFGEWGETPYRNAAGSLASLGGELSRLVFSWSGSQRSIEDTLTSPTAFLLASKNGRAAVCSLDNVGSVALEMSAGAGTGTYTIIIYAD